MVIDSVRSTLRERIERGATLDELDTIVRMSRGLNEEQRSALWLFAWHYEPGSKRARRGGAAVDGGEQLARPQQRRHLH